LIIFGLLAGFRLMSKQSFGTNFSDFCAKCQA